MCGCVRGARPIIAIVASWFCFPKSCSAIAIFVGVYLGVREGLNRFFFQNPDYRLSTLEVSTDGTLAREQILRTAGSLRG